MKEAIHFIETGVGNFINLILMNKGKVPPSKSGNEEKGEINKITEKIFKFFSWLNFNNNDIRLLQQCSIKNHGENISLHKMLFTVPLKH
jgi:hypothetical protein